MNENKTTEAIKKKSIENSFCVLPTKSQFTIRRA